LRFFSLSILLQFNVTLYKCGSCLWNWAASQALGIFTLGNYADHFSAARSRKQLCASVPTLISRDAPSHHESSGMELKDLSSNWKKLQLTLKQNNVALNEQPSTGGREKQRDLKRKRADRSPLRSQSTRYPNTKPRNATAKIDLMPRRNVAVPRQSRPTIPPVGSAPFVADRVNEGLSQTYVANKYRPFFSIAC
jgi:hypothetical protein